jgi:GcrA cell cycle regulator
MNIAAFPSETDPPSTIGWPSEHSKLLKKLTIQGYSFAQISVELWEEFKVSYSRNACIGKASRLGLVAKKASKPSIEGVTRRARPVGKRSGPIATTRLAPFPPSFTSEISEFRCVEVVPQNIRLLDLKPDQCRWPYGEAAPFTFCGHPVVHGSYCAPHHFLSLGPGTESERTADKVSRRHLEARP